MCYLGGETICILNASGVQVQGLGRCCVFKQGKGVTGVKGDVLLVFLLIRHGMLQTPPFRSRVGRIVLELACDLRHDVVLLTLRDVGVVGQPDTADNGAIGTLPPKQSKPAEQREQNEAGCTSD